MTARRLLALVAVLTVILAACDKDDRFPQPKGTETQQPGGEEPGDEPEDKPGEEPSGEQSDQPEQPGEQPEQPGEQPEQPETRGPFDLSVLARPLGEVTVLTSGTWLQNTTVMQSFGLPGDGTMYAVQVAGSGQKHKLNVTHKGITANSGKTRMQLTFFGHGSNMVVERDAAGVDWLWVGNYGTNTYYNRAAPDNVHCTSNQTVARVRYVAGTELRADDVEDQWYIPGWKNVHAAIDFEARQIAFFGYNSNGSSGFFRVYDLDAALALPKKTVTLALQIIRGPSDDYPLTPQSFQATVHDLSELTPLATIPLVSASWAGYPYNFGTGDNQGFEIREGRIYHFHGSGNDSDPSKACESVVSVFDTATGLLLEQYRVMAVASIPDLAAAGLTDYGFMESEGIKIYGETLYLGYTTKKTGDTHRYITILEYPLARKKAGS